MQAIISEFRMRNTRTVWFKGLKNAEINAVNAALPNAFWIADAERERSCDLVIIRAENKNVELISQAFGALKPGGILIYEHMSTQSPVDPFFAARTYGPRRLVRVAMRKTSTYNVSVYYLRDDYDMALASKWLGAAMEEMMDEDKHLAKVWGFRKH